MTSISFFCVTSTCSWPSWRRFYSCWRRSRGILLKRSLCQSFSWSDTDLCAPCHRLWSKRMKWSLYSCGGSDWCYSLSHWFAVYWSSRPGFFSCCSSWLELMSGNGSCDCSVALKYYRSTARSGSAWSSSVDLIALNFALDTLMKNCSIDYEHMKLY